MKLAALAITSSLALSSCTHTLVAGPLLTEPLPMDNSSTSSSAFQVTVTTGGGDQGWRWNFASPATGMLNIHIRSAVDGPFEATLKTDQKTVSVDDASGPGSNNRWANDINLSGFVQEGDSVEVVVVGLQPPQVAGTVSLRPLTISSKH